MMTSWNAEPMPDRSAKAVITLTLLALLLVAAVPVALLAGVVVMLLGHVLGGLVVPLDSSPYTDVAEPVAEPPDSGYANVVRLDRSEYNEVR